MTNPPRSRRAAAFLALSALVVGTIGTALALSAPTSAAKDATAVPANAQRFFALTGGGGGGSKVPPGARLAGGASPASAADNLDAQVTPQGWKIDPAGTQVSTLRFPLGLSVAADQQSMIVSADSGGPQGLQLIDGSTLLPTTTPAANLFVGVATTPDGRVFASGGNADRVFRFRQAGKVIVNQDATEQEIFPAHNAENAVIQRGLPASPVGDGLTVPSYPGGSVLDGHYLYVAGTLSEASSATDPCKRSQACSRVTVIDTDLNGGLGAVVGRVRVGLDAFGLALDAGRKRLYVSNWADEAGPYFGSAGGSVSTIDISNPTQPVELGAVQVGHHPVALQLNDTKTKLFVANSNDDTISVLDVSTTGLPSVTTTESVHVLGGDLVGAHPDAFALSPDGSRLFVALAGLNAVQVLDGHTAAPLGDGPTYIPTGYYPSALAVTGTGANYRLWVANAKGDGPGPGANSSVFVNGSRTQGSVSVIDLKPSTNFTAWTGKVQKNDQLDRGSADPCSRLAGIKPSEVLCPPGGPGTSPIKHVLYIVAENKTFDQYYGDLDRDKYDADPSWLLYGRPVTTNQHALADRFNLSDRFYSDAEVSVTGHSWTKGAIATDHNEKTWEADYDQGIRGTHGGGDPLRPTVSGPAGGQIADADDELQDPENGYIFENFLRHGVQVPSDNPAPGVPSMAIYGEGSSREAGAALDAYHVPGWKDGDIQYFDTCRADTFVTGSSPNGPAPDHKADAYFADCQGRTLPDAFNLKHWTDVKTATGKDVMPNFMYMSLPVNHTVGTNLGSPTPASMVADNDFAIGMIVDALSKSPFWGSTAVFITQDDTQLSGDHVSPNRDFLLTVSPWAKPGANHQWGSMGSLLRTIEQIFGLPAMNIYDQLALPQHGAFVEKLNDVGDAAKYDVLRPLIPFALNEPGAVGQQLSAKLDFSTYDKIDEGILNAILYADARHTPLRLPKGD